MMPIMYIGYYVGTAVEGSDRTETSYQTVPVVISSHTKYKFFSFFSYLKKGASDKAKSWNFWYFYFTNNDERMTTHLHKQMMISSQAVTYEINFTLQINLFVHAILASKYRF